MTDADEYQKQAIRTEKTPLFVSDTYMSIAGARRLERTLHGLLGICTEAGEAQDMVKKHLIYHRPYDAVNMLEEMGDVLWYVALTLDANGYTMGQAMERNLAKLAARYPDGFTPDAANNRDVKAEREILENDSGMRDLKEAVEKLGRGEIIASQETRDLAKKVLGDPNGRVTREPRSCNRHDDCNKADDDYWRMFKRLTDHCNDDCCEDCFGS